MTIAISIATYEGTALGGKRMGGITTHVLDLVRGRPAVGVHITVDRHEGESFRRIGTAVTNADGRVDGPLVSGDDLVGGTYELAFRVGDYFARMEAATGAAVGFETVGAAAAISRPREGSPPFLDVVPLRFGVGDPALHYHVPLLVTPWSYATYRGS